MAKRFLHRGAFRWYSLVVLLFIIVWLFGVSLPEYLRFNRPSREFWEQARWLFQQTPWMVACILIPLAAWCEPDHRDRSRAAGGSGLRFGQGPLPSRDRLGRWLDRWVGSFMGFLTLVAFWLFELAAGLVAMAVSVVWRVSLMAWVATTSYQLAVFLSTRFLEESYWPGLFFLFVAVCTFILVRVLKRTTRRYPNVWGHLFRARLYRTGNRVFDRLWPDPPAETPPPGGTIPRQIVDPS